MPTNGTGWKVAVFLATILSTVATATVSWEAIAIIDLKEKVTRDISSVKESIARLPIDLPPKWYVENETTKFNTLAQRLSEQETTLRQNQALIQELQIMLREHEAKAGR